MNARIYKKLCGVAARRGTVPYQEVGDLVQLDMANPAHRNELAALLGDVSAHEHGLGRPLLSAVVVLAESGWPGQGFFDLARECGRMRADQDNLAFFALELRAVHDHWCPPRPAALRKRPPPRP